MGSVEREAVGQVLLGGMFEHHACLKVENCVFFGEF